jgi:hypothetical protein
MQIRPLLIALVVLGAITLSHAQIALDPSLPKLTNVTFGWVSASGVDPTLPLVNGFAPTMLALKDAGYTAGTEIDYGVFSFNDLTVNADIVSGLINIGPGTARLSRFSFASNNAPLTIMQTALNAGVETNTDGEAYELSYAQKVYKYGTQVGVSYIPRDVSTVNILLPANNIQPTDTMWAHGEMRTDWGVRVGAVQPLPYNISVGANYSYQMDRSYLNLESALVTHMTSGADTAGKQMEAQNITRCGTVGASWQALPNTTVYAAIQQIITSSDMGYKRKAELPWFGVQQSIGEKWLAKLNTVDGGFTKNIMVRANSLDSGMNLMGTWVTKAGALTVSYTNGAVRSAKSELGHGNALIGGVNLAL